MRVVYDSLSDDYNFQKSVQIDYELSEEMKNTDHWYEAGIGWSNRVVSSNVTN